MYLRNIHYFVRIFLNHKFYRVNLREDRIGFSTAYTAFMKLKRLTKTVWVIAVFALLASCEQGSVTEYGPSEDRRLELEQAAITRAQVLVDSDWLVAYGYYPDVHILELGRTSYEFAQSHIPGAKFVDWMTEISDQSKPDMYHVPPVEDFEDLMERLGVTRDSTIILYDAVDNRASARMFWTLKYFNHESVKILDGGLDAWKRSGQEMTDEFIEVVQSDYEVETIRGSILVDMQYILSNLSDRGHKVVDGRPFDQYTGEAEGQVFDAELAHIYGAKSVPWADNLNDDGTFKSSEELLDIYHAHKIFRTKTVVTYCNEGMHAAMPWFVLSEILGYPDVRLYDSSMAE